MRNKELYTLIKKIKNISEDEKDKFIAIMNLMNSYALKLELSLSRILGWSYFTEIQKIKEEFRSEKFILLKQVESLKDRLIDYNSKAFKELQGVSISNDESYDDSVKDILQKSNIIISPPSKSSKNIPSVNLPKNILQKRDTLNPITVNITKVKRKSIDMSGKKKSMGSAVSS